MEHSWCLCLQKYLRENSGQKLHIFYWKLLLIKHSFARTLTIVGFRHRMLSAKLLLVFGVDILLDTNTSNTGILIATELTNEDFIRIMHIVLYQNKWQCFAILFNF